MQRSSRSLVLSAAAFFIAAAALAPTLAAAELPNPFYAMDTSFQRPGSSLEQQLDVVKELGYAGVAWHEQPVEQLRPVLTALEKRGLKMFTIYFAATATPEGKLSSMPNLPAAMDLLQGHGTVLWLHIGGRGPAFASLTDQTPLVQELRKLAEAAKAHDLRFALYPHIGEWTQRVPDCVRLAKAVNHPNFGVGFNLCHALAAGDEANIPAMLDEAKPLLAAATICGADAGVKGAQWDRLIQTLDKGTYDVRIVLRKLRQIGYTGPIGFQGYALRGDARSILVPTMKGWRKLNATLDESDAAAVDMKQRAAELKGLKWGMFVCWSLSTFSGKEWTPGVKDLSFFRATECDTDQWARTAREAGMGYILFLTKHHDGFCLWDTKTTDRKVTKAPLGRDVLAELRKSCDRHGVKLALYFSEGDWNWPGALDGRKSGSNPEMKKAQLKELLTQYGPIEYIWFDHAVGDGGLSHKETVAWCKSFQPGCFVGFNSGEQQGTDIRLAEMGRPGPLDDAKAAPYIKDKPSNSYLLAEFSYPILPPHEGGAMWFYSLPKHDRLCLTAKKLYADFFGAVKYGNIFSVDVGPDYRGRLRQIDVETLRQVGRMIR